MEKVKQPIKKEIRLTFYTKNNDDMKLYNYLVKASSRPGQEIKDLLNKYLFEEKKKSENIESTAIVDALHLIANKLDKLDNLQIVQAATEKSDEVIQEISFTADVSEDDLDDIDF